MIQIMIASSAVEAWQCGLRSGDHGLSWFDGIGEYGLTNTA